MKTISEKQLRSVRNAWGGFVDVEYVVREVEPGDVGKSFEHYNGHRQPAHTIQPGDVGKRVEWHSDASGYQMWCFNGYVVRYREYRCRNCGHMQSISTNHQGPCYDYCHECSWKPGWRSDPSKYGDKSLDFPFNGRTYRPFDYVSEGSD